MSVGTRYGGVVFRDVLHARWAFVFDMLRVDWSYAIVSPAWLTRDLAPAFHLPARRIYFRSEPGVDYPARRAWQDIWNEFEGLCEQDDDTGEDCDDYLIDPHLSVVEPPGSALLVCLNGIPDPRMFDEKGPRGSWNSESMLYLTPTGGQDCPYYWTQCATCGYVDAEFTGRAARLSCGHGDGDKDYRAGSPAILSAYSLAGRAVAARWPGASCPGCALQVQRGDLIVNVGQKWQHARCAYTTVTTRAEYPFTTSCHTDTSDLDTRA